MTDIATWYTPIISATMTNNNTVLVWAVELSVLYVCALGLGLLESGILRSIFIVKRNWRAGSQCTYQRAPNSNLVLCGV